MIKYSEQYDANYNGITREWTESKCDDPTCEYCANRPDKAETSGIRELMIEAGYAAPELAGRAQKFADLLVESIVADLEQFKNGYDDRSMFNLHELVDTIKERIRGI